MSSLFRVLGPSSSPLAEFDDQTSSLSKVVSVPFEESSWTSIVGLASISLACIALSNVALVVLDS